MKTREIKFRGYSEEQSLWVFGSLFKNEICSRIIPFDSVIIENVLDEFYVVNCNSVGQFTGLKDKNGVDIYESDVIEHNGKKYVCGFSNRWGFAFVEINKNLGVFLEDHVLMNSHNHRKQSDIYGYTKYVEIIGNIHSNPELLK